MGEENKRVLRQDLSVECGVLSVFVTMCCVVLCLNDRGR